MKLVAYRLGEAAAGLTGRGSRHIWSVIADRRGAKSGIRPIAQVIILLTIFFLPTSDGAIAQSLDIPLNLVQYGAGLGPNLIVNIGINGQAPRPYLFDTGSPDFVALYDPTAFGSVPSSQNGRPQNQTISYNDGTVYTYNVVASPSFTFYASPTSTTGGVTLNAISPSGASSNFLMGAITSYQNVTFPEGRLTGVFGGDYGIFGAGNFIGVGPGSVLGQSVLPSTTAGYVVAANGQPLSALNSGPGLRQYDTSPNGPKDYQGQGVTSCSPCVMLGLTPALIAQFMPVNEIQTPAVGRFPNSRTVGTYQYPFTLPISATGPGGTTTSVVSSTLLDTGTTLDILSNQIPTARYRNGGTLTVSGSASGATPSTVALLSNTAAANCCNPYYAVQSSDNSTILGLGFFLTNSVLYNLAGQLVGYTPNFVTDANISTTPASTLIIDDHSVPLGLAGIISGDGPFQILSNGSATLSGTNTYTGATVVNNGFLALVGPGSISLSSGVSVSNGGVFDISGVGNSAPTAAYITSLLSMDRTGFVLLGANQLVLTNANGTFGGMIADGGSYGGIGGQLVLAGGRETLSGVNTYTGPTYVDAGTLTITGSIVSAVFVNSGGVLSGRGVVGATTINAGGLLAPANPGSALTVQGSLAFATAGAYLVEINAGVADRVNVNGPATLGGNLIVALVGATIVKQPYLILNATGGIAGTFAGINNLPAGLQGSAAYDANNLVLSLSLNYNALGNLNANQKNVGNALSQFFNASGSIPVSYVGLSPAALSQIAGEAATGSQQMTFQAMSQFINTLLDPFMGGRETTPAASPTTGYAEGGSASAYASSNATRSERERAAYAAVFTKASLRQAYDPHWSVWASGFGGSQTTDGNAAAGSNAATSRIFGMAAGADYLLSPRTITGFALSGGGTNFSVANSGTGRSDLFQAGAYVRHTSGAAYVAGALAYGWQEVTTDRMAMAERLHAEFNANALSGRIEGGYRVAIRWAGVTPYAAGQFTTFWLPAYAETPVFGNGAFALAYGAQTATDVRTEFGVRADRSFALMTGLLTLRGRLAWAHDFNPDRNIAATFQALPGASFIVNGAAQASESALTTASAEMTWRNGWSALVTFEGEFSHVTASYAGKGAVRYAW
ncbi:autotransporter domain-containing protein [Bradyrhizobium genosp. A]|uniref:autotransporter family protein n=1 Tax=Bradyrhizobium genosp. A TaxID=83626 RepID=UPI003CE6D787